MPAREAAKVLEQMDDSDVKEILSRLNDKKAAELLALLPTARAAAVSKSALAVWGRASDDSDGVAFPPEHSSGRVRP